MRTRFLLLLALALGALGCDRQVEAVSPAPTPIPIATPRALLQPVGIFTFTNCTSIAPAFCAFTASLVNNGPGCAYRVEGTLRLFDRTGDLQLGGAYHFALPPLQIVQPGERVAYAVSFVPFDQALRAFSYTVDPLWIDTACH